MKKIITIVIIAALVLAAFSMLSTQSVKAGTSEVSVLSHSWYVAPSNTVLASEHGDLIVVGEVENVGSNIIGNVTVEGTAFSSTEQKLATTTTQAFVYDMRPTQKAPFYLDFTAASSATDDLSWVPSVSSVSVTVTSVTDTTARQYTGLTIPYGSSPYLPGNGSYIVVGTIVNTGNQVAQHPWVVATFYNSSGTVIGLNYTDYLASSMAPGGAVEFFATPADDTSQLTSEIANYTLMVDTLTLTNSASSQPTSSPTPPPSTSTVQFPTLPIVIVVVIVVVVIAALMLLRKRQKLPPPPPPPPSPPMP
ncbi:MAG: FxLYD domain-containing protein [Candidatus Bathyarchaeia archaeon]